MVAMAQWRTCNVGDSERDSPEDTGDDDDDFAKNVFVKAPLRPPTNTEEVLRSSYIVDNCDLARKAIRCIMDSNQELVAVDCRGSLQKIALLQVSTCDGICFIFDLQVCPDIMHKGGLQHLLQDLLITKVMYDCGLHSSVLYNQYQVMLFNVFDVMCAHKIIKSQVVAMHPCLIPPVTINVVSSTYGRGLMNAAPHVIRRELMVEPNFWEKRPLTRKICNYAARGALCLLPEVYTNMNDKIQPLMRTFFNVMTKIKLTYPMTKQDRIEMKIRQHLREAEKLKAVLESNFDDKVCANDNVECAPEDADSDENCENGGNFVDKSIAPEASEISVETQPTNIPYAAPTQSKVPRSTSRHQPRTINKSSSNSIRKAHQQSVNQDEVEGQGQEEISHSSSRQWPRSFSKPSFNSVRNGVRHQLCVNRDEIEEQEPEEESPLLLSQQCPVRVPHSSSKSRSILRSPIRLRTSTRSSKQKCMTASPPRHVNRPRTRGPTPRSPPKKRSPRKKSASRKVNTFAPPTKRTPSPVDLPGRPKYKNRMMRPVPMPPENKYCKSPHRRNLHSSPKKRKLDGKRLKYDRQEDFKDAIFSCSTSEPRAKKSKSAVVKFNGVDLSNEVYSRGSMDSIIRRCASANKQNQNDDDIARIVVDVGLASLNEQVPSSRKSPSISPVDKVQAVVHERPSPERGSPKLENPGKNADKVEEVSSLVLATRRNRMTKGNWRKRVSDESDESSERPCENSDDDDPDG